MGKPHVLHTEDIYSMDLQGVATATIKGHKILTATKRLLVALGRSHFKVEVHTGLLALPAVVYEGSSMLDAIEAYNELG